MFVRRSVDDACTRSTTVGSNILMVGADTGTGKSLLLRAIISALRRKHANRPDYIAVTASTGMAASNIGGECGVTGLGSPLINNGIIRNDHSFLGCSNAREQ